MERLRALRGLGSLGFIGCEGGRTVALALQILNRLLFCLSAHQPSRRASLEFYFA